LERDEIWYEKVFIKGEAEAASRVPCAVDWRVVHFGKLLFKSDKQEFSLIGVES